MTDPDERWEPWQHIDVNLTGGPERIHDDRPTINESRPAGFAPEPQNRPQKRLGEREGRKSHPCDSQAEMERSNPLLWEGDQA